MATGYIPNSTGWSKQSSGPLYYTGWLRLYYSTSYNAANNTSTVTITPQFKSSANLGNDYRFWADANTTDAGIWGGQTGSETKLYTLPTGGYSASGYLKCGQAHNDFVNITNSDGSAFSKSFTIQHDSSGAASFKAGIKCTVTTMYTPGQDGISNAGQKLSDAVSVTGSTYVLTTAVSPSGYGTVTAGATLAPTSTKSLTATPAAATAQYTYAFSSWSKTAGTLSSTTSNPTTFTMGTSAATVTANFTRTPKNYTVSLTAGDYIASVSGGGSKAYGSSVTVTATLGSATGYTTTFDGWYNGSTRVSTSLSYTFTMGAENVSLTAKGTRTANTYTLSVTAGDYIASVSGGGSKAYGSSVTVTATLGSATGYTYSFDGWYNGSTRVSTSLSYTFTYSTAGNLSLTAKGTRTVNSYTLTLTAGTDVASVSGGGSKAYGSSVTASATLGSTEGYNYSFDGWYNGGTKESSSNPYTFTMPAAAKSLTAKATKALKTYTVSYNANGGSSTPTAQTKTYGVALTLAAAITRASASAGSYTVTYNYNGNGKADTTASAARTTNYSFSKWKDGNGNLYNAGGSYTANAAATMTAQWSSTESTASVSLPSATWTGRAFAGWYTAASGGTKVGDAGGSYTPTGNVTLYAHWTINTYAFSATAGTDIASVSLNGTSSASSVSATVNYGSSNTFVATLGSNAAFNYTFDGWYNGANKVSSSLTYTVTATGALALTAKATKTAKQYTLSFTKPNTGGSAVVRRTSSPNGGGSIGSLSNGATLYYGDVLEVSYTEDPGYEVDTHTINGVSFTSPAAVTVTGNVTVVVSMKNAGVVWIWNGTAWEKYIPMIWNGSAWVRYIPVIWNGSAWVIY